MIDLQFPAFKRDIVNYVKDTSMADSDIVVSLFESLDGYIEFRDLYHVQKALEENLPQKKTRYQITDKTREHPNVRTRYTNTTTASDSRSKSTKELEAVNENEERKDYPEVTPTAMRDFICSKCGKSFQNQDDLVHHRNFERGYDIKRKEESREISKSGNRHAVKTRIAKKSLEIGATSPKRVGGITGVPSTNEAININEASKMANLLEGLVFPATKREIKKHMNSKPAARKENIRNLLQAIQGNLQDEIKYNTTYDIEKAIGLVVKKNGDEREEMTKKKKK